MALLWVARWRVVLCRGLWARWATTVAAIAAIPRVTSIAVVTAISGVWPYGGAAAPIITIAPVIAVLAVSAVVIVVTAIVIAGSATVVMVSVHWGARWAIIVVVGVVYSTTSDERSQGADDGYTGKRCGGHGRTSLGWFCNHFVHFGVFRVCTI